ncbi:MAG: gamma carbonic anhydrase family protein [Nitrospirae bacterium]|nr:gamma carbonic anhydrase family protein [Nitrospirota bacterium]MBI3593990.1 gamma carbonic anhydrase family protein [Nitrospirota bacterium]
MMIRYRGILPKLPSSVFVATGAIIIGDVELGENASVWFNTVIRADVHYIRIGANTNIQDLSMLHVTRKTHPLVVGNDVTIGHRVILHGCTVGNLCLIGMGAIIMDGAVIEEGALIGAGSIVSEGCVIPAGMLAFGVPAKPKRPLTSEESLFLKLSAKHYVEDAKIYLKMNLKSGNNEG